MARILAAAKPARLDVTTVADDESWDMRARLSVTITPADIGKRVTVRMRHHGPEARAADVVGVLEAWRDGRLTITRRDGQRRVVAEEDLLAARVVPVPRPRNAAGPSQDTA